jgi:hypothetical protein
MMLIDEMIDILQCSPLPPCQVRCVEPLTVLHCYIIARSPDLAEHAKDSWSRVSDG